MDWDAVRARYTGQAGTDNIQAVIAAKSQSMDTLGLDAYTAGRRGSKYDASGREYWSGHKFDAWKAGHLEMAAEHLAHPEYMTDDRRRAFNYEHI